MKYNLVELKFNDFKAFMEQAQVYASDEGDHWLLRTNNNHFFIITKVYKHYHENNPIPIGEGETEEQVIERLKAEDLMFYDTVINNNPNVVVTNGVRQTVMVTREE